MPSLSPLVFHRIARFQFLPVYFQGGAGSAVPPVAGVAFAGALAVASAVIPPAVPFPGLSSRYLLPACKGFFRLCRRQALGYSKRLLHPAGCIRPPAGSMRPKRQNCPRRLYMRRLWLSIDPFPLFQAWELSLVRCLLLSSCPLGLFGLSVLPFSPAIFQAGGWLVLNLIGRGRAGRKQTSPAPRL